MLEILFISSSSFILILNSIQVKQKTYFLICSNVCNDVVSFEVCGATKNTKTLTMSWEENTVFSSNKNFIYWSSKDMAKNLVLTAVTFNVFHKKLSLPPANKKVTSIRLFLLLKFILIKRLGGDIILNRYSTWKK